jgi:hypothetical protein
MVSPTPVAAARLAVARPLVIELAGLAGAGKSSVVEALTRLDPGVRSRRPLPLRSYLGSVPGLIPTFFALHWPLRRVLTKQVKRVLQVRALHRFARRVTGGGVLVFDEGPVYFLARTLVFGGATIRTAAFERWWRRAVADWAGLLDAVVWLDAPDNVLAARIHARDQSHPMRGADDRAVDGFLGAYRDAFQRVLSDLRAVEGPTFWTLNSDRGSAEETAHALLALLESLRGSR